MKVARRLVPRLGLALLLTGGVIGAGCGAGDADGGPPPLSSDKAPPTKDAGPADPYDSAPGDDAGRDVPAGATTFEGILDKTKPVRFGGKSDAGKTFCTYEVTLNGIAIEVAALESGEVIGATVKDLMVEEVIPECAYGPMAPSAQVFALTTVQATPDGATLAFEGAEANRPKTELVVDLVRVGVTYQAAAVWKRVDAYPVLNWTVKAKLTLAAQ